MSVTCFVVLAAALAAGAEPEPVAATVSALSHRFMTASDSQDAATLKSLAHRDFRFARPGGKKLTIDEYAALSSRRPGGAVTRTWNDESVRAAEGTAVFQGVSRTAMGSTTSDIALTLVWAKEQGAWKLLHLQPSPSGVDAARERWNAMLKGNVVSDKPSQLLLDAIAARKPGKALDLGMGDGRNAIALAQKGWDVTGVEIAEAGAAAAWQSAREKGLSNFAVVLQDANAFDFGEARYDLVALVFFPVAELAPKVQRALKPGGVVVVEAYHSDSAKLKPTGDNVLLDLATLKKLFPGWKVLKAEEPTAVADWGLESRKLVRFVAQKP